MDRTRPTHLGRRDPACAENERGHLAAIVEHSNNAIVSRDLDGTITSWNTGAERMFGYRASEAIGRPITMLMPPGLPSRLELNTQTVRSGVPVEPFESQRLTKAGGTLDVLVSVSPLRDGRGRVTLIPYKGSAPSLVDLPAGHVFPHVDQISSALPYIRAGTIRAIAVTTAELGAWIRSDLGKWVKVVKQAGIKVEL